MPELPEVETVKRGLAPVMDGRRILRVEQRRPDLRFPFPERFAARLAGRRIDRLGRRAKYILAHLEGDEILTMHLGMSGRFAISEHGAEHGVRPPTSASEIVAEASNVGGLTPSSLGGLTPALPARQLGKFEQAAGNDPAHNHAVFHMEGGVTVTYNDARRFGYMGLIGAAEMATHPHFAGLGIEPLGNELTPHFLAEQADGRKTDLKAFLMDQRIVCGLGNIYVCEALFRSGLSPMRQASSLAGRGGRPSERAERLVPEIRAVLAAAIEAGGSTLRDYKKADGSLGYFQHAFAVYGREGEPCARPGCAGSVRRTVQAGRSTFHCLKCQR